MTDPAALARLNQAIKDAYLDDGEIPICWVLTFDVAGPADVRYLAHRSGGGVDGRESPTAWTALGMLEASVGIAREQLSDCTVDADDDDEADG